MDYVSFDWEFYKEKLPQSSNFALAGNKPNQILKAFLFIAFRRFPEYEFSKKISDEKSYLYTSFSFWKSFFNCLEVVRRADLIQIFEASSLLILDVFLISLCGFSFWIWISNDSQYLCRVLHIQKIILTQKNCSKISR